MPYKDPQLHALAKRLWRMKRAEQAGRVYHPRCAEERERKERRRLWWRVIQAIYRRITVLTGKTAKRRQYESWKERNGAARAERRRRQYAEARGGVVQARRRTLTEEERRESRAIDRKNREARKRVHGGRLSYGIRKKLFLLQRGRCAVCHGGLETGGPLKYHLDHIEPLALGGPHTDKNMQLLCPVCNVRKGAKAPLVFMQSIGKLL